MKSYLYNDEQQEIIKSMTNWQNSQWQRSKLVGKDATVAVLNKYASMEKEHV